MRRDWTAARRKVDSELECRVCRSGDSIQAAHVMGRKYDAPHGRVDPDDIVPLCPNCHLEYDGRGVDLLPYLNYREQAAAVRYVGIVRALNRISGKRDR